MCNIIIGEIILIIIILSARWTVHHPTLNKRTLKLFCLPVWWDKINRNKNKQNKNKNKETKNKNQKQTKQNQKKQEEEGKDNSKTV